jgi:hypothetical protein
MVTTTREGAGIAGRRDAFVDESKVLQGAVFGSRFLLSRFPEDSQLKRFTTENTFPHRKLFEITNSLLRS